MALPSTGPIKFSEIAAELGVAPDKISLRSLSQSVCKSSPDSVSEFRGYSIPSITGGNSALFLNYNTNSYNSTISSNWPVTYSIYSDNIGISVTSLSQNSLTLSIPTNSTYSARTGNIKITTNSGCSSRDKYIEFNITQRAYPNITWSVSTLTWAENQYGDRYTTATLSDTSQRWVLSYIPTDITTVSPEVLVGAPQTVTVNLRTASTSVYTKTGAIQYTLESDSTVKKLLNYTIEAKTPSITVNSTSFSFTSGYDTKTLNISSNTSWAISNLPSWCNASITSGGVADSTSSQNVTLDCKPNPETSTRSEKFTIATTASTKLPYTINVTITQEAMVEVGYITVDPTFIWFPGEYMKEQTLSLYAEGNWSITDKPNWVWFSKTSGYGAATILVSAMYNSDGGQRMGQVTFVSNGAVAYLEVEQGGVGGGGGPI